MKQLVTQTEINASPENVWRILTDFEKYPDWNPFIKKLTGDVRIGSHIEVMLHPPGGSPMKFKPIVQSFDRLKTFSWKGKLFIAGIFDGEHIFELKPAGAGKTLFIQRENFAGILVPFLGKMLDGSTRQGFEEMNAKLKELAERPQG